MVWQLWWLWSGSIDSAISWASSMLSALRHLLSTNSRIALLTGRILSSPTVYRSAFPWDRHGKRSLDLLELYSHILRQSCFIPSTSSTIYESSDRSPCSSHVLLYTLRRGLMVQRTIWTLWNRHMLKAPFSLFYLLSWHYANVEKSSLIIQSAAGTIWNRQMLTALCSRLPRIFLLDSCDLYPSLTRRQIQNTRWRCQTMKYSRLHRSQFIPRFSLLRSTQPPSTQHIKRICLFYLPPISQTFRPLR